MPPALAWHWDEKICWHPLSLAPAEWDWADEASHGSFQTGIAHAGAYTAGLAPAWLLCVWEAVCGGGYPEIITWNVFVVQGLCQRHRRLCIESISACKGGAGGGSWR